MHELERLSPRYSQSEIEEAILMTMVVTMIMTIVAEHVIIPTLVR